VRKMHIPLQEAVTSTLLTVYCFPVGVLRVWLSAKMKSVLRTSCAVKLKLKSKSHYDRRSVGQSFLVWSPIWGSWPDINFCLTFTVLSMSGAPSDGRSGLSSILVTWTASVQ
jgi:hypothetical protein